MSTYHITPHPGNILGEKLQEMDMSVKEFASRAEKSEKYILDVIAEKSSISPDLAIAIEFVTGMEASVILKWQRDYDEELARYEMQSRIKSSNKEWLNSMPVTEMVKNGWIKAQTTADKEYEELLRFFGVVSQGAWEDYYFKRKLKVAFRISLETTTNPRALSAWLRRGEIQANDIYLDNEYSPAKLKAVLEDISLILTHPSNDVMTILKDTLASVGVKLVYTEPLSSISIKGATRWIGGHPCIQLLNTVEVYEDYAYTVLHEIGHILLHGKKDVFLEETGYASNTPSHDEKEAEADTFAKKWLSHSTAIPYRSTPEGECLQGNCRD